jgi:ribosomal-protein-alanine N-acetyltransferase
VIPFEPEEYNSYFFYFQLNIWRHICLQSSNGIKIRKATKDDLSAIITIEDTSFNWFERFPESLFLYYIRKLKDGFFVVLEPSGAIVGYAILVDVKNYSYIFSIAILPKKRNQGYAELLLKFLTKRCTEKHIPKIRLDVRVDNNAAVELYKKLGYTEVNNKKDYYGDGLDALMMEKMI